MTSIGKVWQEFDHTEGSISLEEFEKVMIDVAKDQNLYEGTEEEVQLNTIFFTKENLVNIFNQILDQEEGPKHQYGEITHTSVVDILYNVFNQIEQNRNDRE